MLKETVRRKLLVALAAVAVLAVPAPAVAGPATDDLLSRQATSAAELQAQIDRQLQVVPGGEQTAVNEVSYGGGRFVVTYARPGATQLEAPDCPSGSFCFYDSLNFVYPRGRLSDYGWQDLATWNWQDRTESVHNMTNTGVVFQNHTSGGHGNDQVLFCQRALSADPNVYPYANVADHVHRFTDTTC
ncbi:peptidase inhibitor family I36 protein [Actinoplanes sp. NPDC049265]|uniref:peptidase inhibitor family I36 protein n=1 Tax=Actinoplanes sp. NPDC049265 TaxID=3363902 RepID=UPI00371F2E7F